MNQSATIATEDTPELLEAGWCRLSRDLVGASRLCLVASFTLGGMRFEVSRYRRERYWTLDALFTPSGDVLPDKGTGIRTGPRRVLSGRLQAWLDSQVAELRREAPAGP